MIRSSKRASMYVTNGRILLHAMSRTTSGAWIRTGEVLALSLEALGTSLLATTVLTVLDQSKLNVPHPTSWEGFGEPLLRAAGVKSRERFYDGAKAVDISVGIDAGDNEITLAPNKNFGSKTGFAKIKDKVIQCRRSEQKLAEALSRALELSE